MYVEQRAFQKRLMRARAAAHGPRRFMARAACRARGDGRGAGLPACRPAGRSVGAPARRVPAWAAMLRADGEESGATHACVPWTRSARTPIWPRPNFPRQTSFGPLSETAPLPAPWSKTTLAKVAASCGAKKRCPLLSRCRPSPRPRPRDGLRGADSSLTVAPFAAPPQSARAPCRSQ